MNTEEMAEIIADALVSGGVLRKEDFAKAVEIAEEEMRVRIVMGDPIEVGTP